MEQQLHAKLKMKSAWRHQKHSLTSNVSTMKKKDFFCSKLSKFLSEIRKKTKNIENHVIFL